MPTKRVGLVLVALLASCGGAGTDEAGDAAEAPAGAEPGAMQAPGDTVAGETAAAAQSEADSILADSIRQAEMRLSRETFSYGGGSRDPFSSLLNLRSSGPEISDLELVGIYLDPDRPSNSVALLRERASGRPHKLRVGDEVGRGRLSQIRRTDVVFTIEDFGFERQETIALPKREEGTP